MRDIGFEFFWHDPNTENLFAKGFEHKQAVKPELVTCVECFEHFENPLEDIAKIFELSHNVLFTTELISTPVPDIDTWWYYGRDHGQHISFYSKKTMHYIAEKYKVNYYQLSDQTHLFLAKKVNKKMLSILGMLAKMKVVRALVSRRLLKKTWTDYQAIVERS
jgi:hypothetical protein